MIKFNLKNLYALLPVPLPDAVPSLSRARLTVSTLEIMDHALALAGPTGHAQDAARIQDAEAIAPARPQSSPGRTLLPTPVANAVSLATRSTSFALRVGTAIGGYGLSAAKFTTLSSLELSRGILEGILHRAGKDVASRSQSDLGRADAETILERSFEGLHQSLNRIVFWTTTGFHFTGTAVSTASQVSQLFLSFLDQFFGSTDSSRAIASIITLVRREFQNPATGIQGERVGVIDLILGLCGLAYLQSQCRKMIEEESSRLRYEEVIWDVVVLNDDEPVGMHEDSLYGVHKGNYTRPGNAHDGNDDVIGPIERHGTTQNYGSDVDDELLERHIISSLPEEAKVSITTSTTVTKTITVEVEGTSSLPLVALPGVDLVESEVSDPSSSMPGLREKAPIHKVVYRLSRNRVQRIDSNGMEEDQPRIKVIEVQDNEISNSQYAGQEKIDDQPPAVPPKEYSSQTGSLEYTAQTSTKGRLANQQPPVSSAAAGTFPNAASSKDRISNPPTPQDFENAANQKKVRRPLDESRPSLQHTSSSSRAGHKHRSKKLRLPENSSSRTGEKKGGFRSALKRGTVSNLLNRDSKSDNPPLSNKQKATAKPTSAINGSSQSTSTATQGRGSPADRKSNSLQPGNPPQPPQRGNPNFFSSRDLGDISSSSERYSRYASAAYGWNFLRFMGIRKEMPVLKPLDETHRDIRSFAHHTELPQHSILLSSFVDPQGGSDSTGSTGTGVPLVHTIALDEESKAVVLACRGTLGFEDVLVDMMCDYDDLVWRGKSYKVHKGIHASARRLLYGGDGRVLATLKEALEEFPDYGLILCGHSLGGAVTALLGAMLAEPASTGTAFVTSGQHQHYGRLLTGGGEGQRGNGSSTAHICLPSGRPIHVYAYGPPATMSPALQKATRGLITSTVHGNDLVPYLSLGVLHDFQALALAFKSDNSAAKAEVRRRIWEGMQSGIADRFWSTNNAHNRSRTRAAESPSASSSYTGSGLRPEEDGEQSKGLGDEEEGEEGSEDEDEGSLWAYAALKTLRATMMSCKLLPPGEVFAVESAPTLRRDAFLGSPVRPGTGTGGVQQQHHHFGRPATRVVLKYVRDVEARFREVRFGASMLMDHSPGRYEDALRRLSRGVGTSS
ncbi:hypothetical protein DL764_003098 [Monosporascus ibericus]|uniref:sn-1-specific diacylglycerol lipase n=1 Tax=Monosporascus ibericus TaxID=155417 RepID=A0A4Q4TMK6_9PEZI|nr:hypothetical protein DL764_003098 [Monosporascus ibericus]